MVRVTFWYPLFAEMWSKDMGRSSKALATAATAALTASLAVAIPPSSANAAASSCSINYVCLWGNNNYSGSPWFEKATLGRHNTGYFNNDETSSAWNRKANASVLLYNKTNADSSGGVVCLPRNYASRDLNDESPEFDDRISSLYITTKYCGDYPGIAAIGGKKSK